jgi:hypothetical protein
MKPKEGTTMDASTITDTDYQVGDIVELCAEPCRTRCENDCACRALAARNGHTGHVLNVQAPLFGGEAYYQVDGIDQLLYAYELRAATP